MVTKGGDFVKIPKLIFCVTSIFFQYLGKTNGWHADSACVVAGLMYILYVFISMSLGIGLVLF